MLVDANTQRAVWLKRSSIITHTRRREETDRHTAPLPHSQTRRTPEELLCGPDGGVLSTGSSYMQPSALFIHSRKSLGN
ncbi:hypothetical protein AGIG_G6362 [Arapaima gigas]